MFFDDFFSQGGFPGGGFPGGMQREREPVDTESAYKVLGVAKSATQKEIKKAHRKLAMKHHPDRGGDEAKFKEIQEAYDLVGSEEKRAKYDKYGAKGAPEGGGGLFDLFNGPQRRDDDDRANKPEPIRESLDLSLEDVYSGPTTTITVKYSSASSRTVCNRCNGNGMVMQRIQRGPMIMQTQRACNKCSGKGVSYRNKKTLSKTVDVHIPVGIQNKDKIFIRNEGHQFPEGKGDIIVATRVKKHPLFERIGADLAFKKSLTLKEALTGYKFKIKHVSGVTLVVSSSPGEIVRPNSMKMLKEWGLPQKGGYGSMKGNLYIKFNVLFPRTGQIKAKQMKSLTSALNGLQYEEEKKEESQFDIGCMVRIVNLSNYPQLNNKTGKILGAGRAGRWAVELQGHNQQAISVPEEKLQLLKPVDASGVKRKQREYGTDEDVDEDDMDYEEEVKLTDVDGDEINATPAKAEGQAYEADDDENDQQRAQECRMG